MLSIGLGTVTFVGLQAALDAAVSSAQSALGGLPADVALIVARFGFFDYLAILVGGLMGGVSWLILKRMVAV
jgi:hypothetical protein